MDCQISSLLSCVKSRLSDGLEDFHTTIAHNVGDQAQVAKTRFMEPASNAKGVSKIAASSVVLHRLFLWICHPVTATIQNACTALLPDIAVLFDGEGKDRSLPESKALPRYSQERLIDCLSSQLAEYGFYICELGWIWKALQIGMLSFLVANAHLQREPGTYLLDGLTWMKSIAPKHAHPLFPMILRRKSGKATVEFTQRQKCDFWGTVKQGCQHCIIQLKVLIFWVWNLSQRASCAVIRHLWIVLCIAVSGSIRELRELSEDWYGMPGHRSPWS